MTKVLLVYEIIPESTKTYLLNVTDPELEDLKLAHKRSNQQVMYEKN